MTVCPKDPGNGAPTQSYAGEKYRRDELGLASERVARNVVAHFLDQPDQPRAPVLRDLAYMRPGKVLLARECQMPDGRECGR